jgi:DNA-binding CsgD family transcriptional regulator
MKTDVIAVVESAYDLEPPSASWMQSLVEHTVPLVAGAGPGAAYSVDASDPRAPSFGVPVVVGMNSGIEQALHAAILATDARTLMHAHEGKATTFSAQLGSTSIAGNPLGDFLLACGLPDVFCCIGLDAEGRGIVVSAALARKSRLARGTKSCWQLVSAHVAAASRLRARASDSAPVEGLFDPGGRAVHCDGDAKARPARDALRAAVVARDKARTKKVRRDEAEALSLWPGLVAGRWSLVDRFERDGRRYVVARRNEPRPPEPFVLSIRERQVLGHLIQGDSLKLTAYALGLSLPSVSKVAATLRVKLGVRTVAGFLELAMRGG